MAKSRKMISLNPGELAAPEPQPDTAQTEPHPHEICQKALDGLKNHVNGSCIVNLGETGSGKTHNTDMILRYFAAHSDQRSGRRDAEQLFEVVKYAIDLVEAFGNATTKQNSNSSRFGRVFKIKFDIETETVASIGLDTFLLERKRALVLPGQDGQFHVMTAIANEAGSGSDSGTPTVDLENIRRRLARFFQPEEIRRIVDTLFGLHHLRCNVHGPEAGAQFQEVARLWDCVPAPFLEELLTARRFANELIGLDQDEADAVRENAGGWIYQALFNYLIAGINKTLDTVTGSETLASKELAVISVIDSPGFENLPFNGLFQFSYNCLNEALQAAHEEFVSTYADNPSDDDSYPSAFGDVNSLLKLLDDASKSPAARDRLFAAPSKDTVGDTSTLVRRVEPSTLAVQHYAGPVTYDIAAIVDCNGNSGADVAAAIVEKSKALAHLRPFFQAQRGHKKLPSTLATSHQSCKELARTVLTSDQLYMFRCIRPFTVGQKSMDHQSRPIDLTEIERQVRTIGLLRTAQVMGLAFAVKLSICEFAERFALLLELSPDYDLTVAISDYLHRAADVAGLPETTFSITLNHIHLQAALHREICHKLEQRLALLDDKNQHALLALGSDTEDAPKRSLDQAAFGDQAEYVRSIRAELDWAANETQSAKEAARIAEAETLRLYERSESLADRLKSIEADLVKRDEQILDLNGVITDQEEVIALAKEKEAAIRARSNRQGNQLDAIEGKAAELKREYKILQRSSSASALNMLCEFIRGCQAPSIDDVPYVTTLDRYANLWADAMIRTAGLTSDERQRVNRAFDYLIQSGSLLHAAIPLLYIVRKWVTDDRDFQAVPGFDPPTVIEAKLLAEIPRRLKDHLISSADANADILSPESILPPLRRFYLAASILDSSETLLASPIADFLQYLQQNRARFRHAQVDKLPALIDALRNESPIVGDRSL